MPDGGTNTDEWIADRLEAAIRDDPRIHGRYLDIQVQGRVVILDGELDTGEARTAVRLLAWSTPGVRDVCNTMRVVP